MRALFILLLFAPFTLHAQNAERFARALRSNNPHALDRWMKRELMAHKKGTLIDNGSTTYADHDPTYDSLVTFLRKQPRVLDSAWDGCVGKIDIWPGHSTIGLRVLLNGVEHERCYKLQEGRPGTINVFGWWPKITERKSKPQCWAKALVEYRSTTSKRERMPTGTHQRAWRSAGQPFTIRSRHPRSRRAVFRPREECRPIVPDAG